MPLYVGPGLAFIVYPEALARMPVAPLWSVFFFIMMATLGFGSQFSIIECVLSSFSDEFPQWLKPKKNNIIYRIVACVLMFLLGLPMVSQVSMLPPAAFNILKPSMLYCIVVVL